MKKLSLILLLLAAKSQAQTRFFVGIGGAYNHCSIQNKEDKKAPSGMLKQKGTFQPSYGLQLGVQFGKHWELSLAPNYQNFKTTYSGKSDSLLVGEFDNSLSLSYYNCPLIINYCGHLSDKLSVFGGVSVNAGFLKTYTEHTKGHYLDGSLPPIEFTNVNTDKTGYIDFILFTPTGKMTRKYDKPFYNSMNIELGVQTGLKYLLNDHLSLNLTLQLMKGFTDIENKTKITEIQDYQDGAVPRVETYEAWKETSYYRFYPRPASEFNKRPASTSLSIGFGLGVQYSFGNSNSSTNNYQ